MSAWRSSRTLVVGHRGGRDAAWPPENSIEAFERARVSGADAIELDVRSARGGEVVVFHDVAIDRMIGAGDRRRVCDLAWAELRAMRLAGADARVPSLAEALRWGEETGTAVNVEIKHDVPDRFDLVRGTIAAIRGANADVLISSFDPVVLAMCAALAPLVPRAQLTHGKEGALGASLHVAVRRPFCTAVHLEAIEVVAPTLRMFKRRKLRVGVWTVNDPKRATALRDAGIDWVITDRADVIAKALTSASG